MQPPRKKKKTNVDDTDEKLKKAIIKNLENERKEDVNPFFHSLNETMRQLNPFEQQNAKFQLQKVIFQCYKAKQDGNPEPKFIAETEFNPNCERHYMN